MNFNQDTYINYITERISNCLQNIENVPDKIDFLQFHLKEFNQLYIKSKVAFNDQHPDIKHEINNWLSQEIRYFRKKVHLPNLPVQNKLENPIQKIEKEKCKVLCLLSTDQIAIALRAFDELRVLKARSMNEVFKTIVPHLSTPFKQDLSYDSVRSKSYSAEERDKKIVIETLEKIIEKIKRY